MLYIISSVYSIGLFWLDDEEHNRLSLPIIGVISTLYPSIFFLSRIIISLRKMVTRHLSHIVAIIFGLAVTAAPTLIVMLELRREGVDNLAVILNWEVSLAATITASIGIGVGLEIGLVMGKVVVIMQEADETTTLVQAFIVGGGVGVGMMLVMKLMKTIQKRLMGGLILTLILGLCLGALLPGYGQKHFVILMVDMGLYFSLFLPDLGIIIPCIPKVCKMNGIIM